MTLTHPSALLAAAIIVTASPALAQTQPSAPVRLLAQEPGVTFHLQTGTSQAVAFGGGMTAVAFGATYQRLCTAPCETSLPFGDHILALSLDERPPVAAGVPLVVQGPSAVVGSYTSRTGTRVAGLLTLLGGTGAGLSLGLAGLLQSEQSCDDYGCMDVMAPSWPLVITGAAIELASVIVGLILMRTPDSADLELQTDAAVALR